MEGNVLIRADITHTELQLQTPNCPCTKAVGRIRVTARNLLGRWREEAVTFLRPPDAKRHTEWTPSHTTHGHMVFLFHVKTKTSFSFVRYFGTASLYSRFHPTWDGIWNYPQQTIQEYDLKIALQRTSWTNTKRIREQPTQMLLIFTKAYQIGFLGK